MIFSDTVFVYYNRRSQPRECRFKSTTRMSFLWTLNLVFDLKIQIFHFNSENGENIRWKRYHSLENALHLESDENGKISLYQIHTQTHRFSLKWKLTNCIGIQFEHQSDVHTHFSRKIFWHLYHVVLVRFLSDDSFTWTTSIRHCECSKFIHAYTSHMVMARVENVDDDFRFDFNEFRHRMVLISDYYCSQLSFMIHDSWFMILVTERDIFSFFVFLYIGFDKN